MKVKLKDVSDLITKGTTPSTIGENFIEQGVNFVKAESINEGKYLNSNIFEHISIETNEKLLRSQLKENDLLFSIAGAYLGKIGIVRKIDLPLNTNQAVGIVRINPQKAYYNYIYYYFSQKNINKYISRLSAQSGQPNLNLELLGNLEFDNLDVNKQKKLVNILCAIDDKIENNKKINSELESMAKTIYDYWFLQFEFPNDEGKPYKASGGKMVWNEELKKEIPDRWEVKKLGDIFEFIKGKIPEKISNKKNSNYVEYLTIGAVNGEESGYCDKDSMVLTDGEVLMVMDGAASSEVYVGNTGAIGSTFCKLDIKDRRIDNNFLFLIMKKLEKVFKKVNTGSTVPHANKNYINNFMIALPCENHTMQIIKKDINLFIQNVSVNKKENKYLSSLRDFLLPLLMNGQVRFKDNINAKEIELGKQESVISSN